MDGIENIDGNLNYTATSNQAISPVESSQPTLIEQPVVSSQPATAPPNVTPRPPAATAPSEVPGTPAPVSTVEPSQPALTRSHQKVLVFDANHPGLAVGSGALRPQGHFTLEAWVCPATDAGKQVILAEGESSD